MKSNNLLYLEHRSNDFSIVHRTFSCFSKSELVRNRLSLTPLQQSCVGMLLYFHVYTFKWCKYLKKIYSFIEIERDLSSAFAERRTLLRSMSWWCGLLAPVAGQLVVELVRFIVGWAAIWILYLLRLFIGSSTLGEAIVAAIVETVLDLLCPEWEFVYFYVDCIDLQPRDLPWGRFVVVEVLEVLPYFKVLFQQSLGPSLNTS